MNTSHEKSRHKVCCVCMEDKGRSGEDRPLSEELVTCVKSLANPSFSLEDPRWVKKDWQKFN